MSRRLNLLLEVNLTFFLMLSFCLYYDLIKLYIDTQGPSKRKKLHFLFIKFVYQQIQTICMQNINKEMISVAIIHKNQILLTQKI
jgi:hypothetical protein